MVNFDYSEFVEYVLKDSYISSLKILNNNISKEIESLYKELNFIENEYQNNFKKINLLRKYVSNLELELKSLDYNYNKKLNDLNSVKSHKEYESLQLEINILLKNKNELDSLIISKWLELEKEESNFLSQDYNYLSKKKDILNKIDKNKQKINEINQELNNNIAELENMRLSLILNKQDWLDDYNNMKLAIDNPAVPLSANQICSGCFYILSNQDIAILNKNYIVKCKNCYRFVYLNKQYT